MNFQIPGKQLFGDYGIAVPRARLPIPRRGRRRPRRTIGGDFWVVKAQIHAGGRGKAGGVKLAKTLDEMKRARQGMLGTSMATYQTAGVELPVDSVLVTQATDIARSCTCRCWSTAPVQLVTFIASAEGGMDIEQVAHESRRRSRPRGFRGRPAAVPDPRPRVRAGPERQAGGPAVEDHAGPVPIACSTTRTWPGRIEPAGDPRHRRPGRARRQDQFRRQRQLPPRHWSPCATSARRDETEVLASKYDLNYVTMDGNIGCMVNGAAWRWRPWT